MRVDAERLAHALARHLGGRYEVADLEQLSGGASRETWAFRARRGEDELHLVLRRDPGDRLAGQTERATEYELLAAAAASGVPVPRVRFLLDERDGLGSGFVMDRVEGETIARRILRDGTYRRARARLTEDCARAAAAIHAVDVAALPALPVLDGAAQVVQWRRALDGFGEPRPAFELALQWLEARCPAPPRSPRLVHGDFRLGNLVVGPDGLRAVLDWELAHLGDPVEDLGWLCVKSWRFGHADRVVAGVGEVDDLLDAYAQASGEPVDVDVLRWWCTLGTLKWGLITRLQAEAHLSGALRSMELATLGRRIAEMEWDVLSLIEGGW